MILVKISGGLGNQFFQYAFAKAIEKKTKQPVFLHGKVSSYSRNFLLDKFYINLPIRNAVKAKSFVKKKSKNVLIRFFYAGKVFSKRTIVINEDPYHRTAIENYLRHLNNEYDYYFSGYWQSTSIPELVSNDLLQALQPISPLSREAIDLLELISNNACPVAVHLRLRWNLGGDGVTLKSLPIQESLSLDYYHKSIQLIKQKVLSPTFFIFADDISAAKTFLSPLYKELKRDSVFMTHGKREPWEELHLIQCCQHFILSNSTFCWWASWLASKHNPQQKEMNIIMPNNWYGYNPGVMMSKRLKVTQQTLLLK